ncbi:amidohydrolase family protein [Pseudidiomarina donghaiensis]|nr:amidohydrolase family protein [Pseudidiomarina donghaiensis]SFV22830.1 Amidohydrolase family protein [Pseudidiomarina donghaiensis]
MKIKSLAKSLMYCGLVTALTACSSSGVDRSDLDETIQRYHAVVLDQEPVTLNSRVPEGMVTGASYGLFDELDGDSEDMISGVLAGVLVGGVVSALADGSNDAIRYRLYHQDKGEFAVISKQQLGDDVQCVEVQQAQQVKLYAVHPEFCQQAQDEAPVKVIYGARVKQPGTSDWRTATVTVKNEHIAAVTEINEEIPTGAQLIDARGTWLIPGLIDGHVHLSQSGSAFTRPDIIGATELHSYDQDQAWLTEQLPDILHDYLRLGITTVADLGGPTQRLQSLNQLDCTAGCPTILSAGELISVAPVAALDGDHGPTFLAAATPAEATAAVKMQRGFGAQISKFVFTNEAGLSPQQLQELFAEAIAEAKAHGQIIAVHAQDLDYAKAAIRAGADILVHGVMTAAIDREFTELALARDVTYMPTLTAYEHYLSIFKQQLTFTAFEQQFADAYVLNSFAQLQKNLSATDQMFQIFTRYVPLVDASPEERAALSAQEQAIVQQLEALFSQRILQAQYSNLRAALDAGLQVGFGTDAGNPGTLHAVAVAEEIRAWQRAGVSAAEIFQALTLGNAMAFDIAQQQGVIAQGKTATFNLLQRDPSQDPQALLTPTHVFQNGTLVYDVDDSL